MSKKNIVIGFFLVLCLGTAFIQYKRTLPVTKVTRNFTFSITQTIAGTTKGERIKVGSTALQLLNVTHKIITKGENENAFVTTIDGRLANTQNREFWAFYVNGKQAEVGAGSYVVKNNDTIEWKIETY